MVQFEYFPAVVEAHRNDLRAIAQPLPQQVVTTSWRRAVAFRLIQLGRWLEGARPTITADPSVALGESPGRP